MAASAADLAALPALVAAAAAADAAAAASPDAAGTITVVVVDGAAGTTTAAGSSFLPQATSAAADMRAANTNDLFIYVYLKVWKVSCVNHRHCREHQPRQKRTNFSNLAPDYTKYGRRHTGKPLGRSKMRLQRPSSALSIKAPESTPKTPGRCCATVRRASRASVSGARDRFRRCQCCGQGPGVACSTPVNWMTARSNSRSRGP